MKKGIFIFFLLCYNICFAQNEYIHWVQQGYTIDFCDSFSWVNNNVNVGTMNGCATICNKSTGQILFFTNGIEVLNTNLQRMPNGNNLAGDQESTQTALIVPQPGSDSIYYIFTTDRLGDPPGALEYSIVDMSKDSNLGDVTVKNIFLDSTTEKLNAVYNSDGNFFWVIALNPTTNYFMSFRLDSNGIDITPVLSQSGVVITNTYQRSGNLKSSPNGENIVAVFEGEPYTIGLYNFNKTSGELNLITFLPLDIVDDDAWGHHSHPIIQSYILEAIPVIFTQKFINMIFQATILIPSRHHVYYWEL